MSNDLAARVAAAQALAAAASPGPWTWIQDQWNGGFSSLVAGNMDVLRPSHRNEGDTGAAWFDTVTDGDLALTAAAPELAALVTALWRGLEEERDEAARWKESAAIHRRAADRASRVLFDQFRVADPGTAAAYLARAEAAEIERDEARAEVVRLCAWLSRDGAAWGEHCAGLGDEPTSTVTPKE